MILTILHRDDDLLVVDKPAGIPTHAADPDDPARADALRIAQAQTGIAHLGMHQRLDAETSGVLLFSARREANRALAAAFEGGGVRKTYLALVHGRPKRPEGLLDAPIVRERDGRYRATSLKDPRGLPARTRYRVLETRRLAAAGPGLPGAGEVSLLEITPETGRSHQIRVHLAGAGCPVVGDPLYGAPDRPFPRLCLHAVRLALPHPATGEAVSFEAPLPPPFDRLAAGLPEVTLAAARLPARQAAEQAPSAFRALLALAAARRAPLQAGEDTTFYRLANGAGDGAPGLAVDRCGDALVASLYDDDPGGAAAPAAAPLPRALLEGIGSLQPGAAVYVKRRPREAGRLDEAALAELAPAAPAWGPKNAPSAEIALEEGLRYLLRPGEGLSAGLFADMRDGRARVRAWAAGKTVLNCFAYTCGFGAAALAGGASRVLNLDLSKGALAWGQDNLRLNGFTPDPHDFVYGDVFDWLARLAKRGDRFDLVILDPPGFSRTKTRRFSAAQDYGELAGLASRVTAPGGLLLACCNVAGLPWRSFRDRALAGIAAARRTATVEGVYHEPGLDYPSAPGAEPYLKMLAARLD